MKSPNPGLDAADSVAGREPRGERSRAKRRTFLVTAAIAGPAVLLLSGPWSLTATPALSVSSAPQLATPPSDVSTPPPTETPASGAPATRPEKEVSATVTSEPVLSESERLAAQLVGSWDDEFYGKRRFEFRSDQTATMTIELDSVGKLLYGPKLRFFIRWQMEGNELHLVMTGGEPADTAKTVAKIFGESSRQRIESISADELKLRSLDSGNLYTHRRVAGTD